ncbi:S9 family peptidase [Anaerobacillus alkaliphilus]|uniref:S9 family peptidase n=1 Tax=Anaerobacillus alkaliphilus TaxID=1548597 RepID=A0A4V1LGV4_9BACI|nr:S9 family peptidase [Anaerobacillus alkaliphilus]RXJ04045.1 S9 family peptidase [Anaerobacillus alkaliphilus]
MIQFPKPDVDQFFRTYAITTFAISKDEKKLIFSSNINGKQNLWAIDFPNQFPYLFAQVDQQCNFIKIDGDNRYVLAGFDHDGDENYQIYALPFEGGKPQPLITGEKTDKFFYADSSKDGERVYYMTSKGNPQFLNLHRYDITSNEDVLVDKGEGAPTYMAALAPDESSYVTISSLANTYSLGYVVVNGEKRLLTPTKEEVHTVTNPVYTDENTIYFVTNFGEEFSYIASYNLVSGEFLPVKKIPSESVKNLKWNKTFKSFFFVTEKGVTDQLYSYSLDTEEVTKLEAPTDVIEQLTVAESGTVYVLGRSATIPFNIFRLVQGEHWEQITTNHVLGITSEQMVEPDVVTYPSFDGLEIEALYFKAKPELANGYTIFWPHGGPQAAERKSFRAMFQCFLNRGYSIFAPNFRGSTGYGSSFVKLVEGDWGEGPRLDCVHGIQWLFDQKASSPEKLFVVGGSYGGYMALLLAGRHADLFKATVDIFGVSNLFTFLNSVPEHWKPMMKRWLGDAVEDKERLEKDSPITYLDTMTNPMLVIQGANDPRVVKEESDQIVAALEKNGVDVEYLVLDDEGHGFSKKHNEIKVYETMLEFLAKHQ